MFLFCLFFSLERLWSHRNGRREKNEKMLLPMCLVCVWVDITFITSILKDSKKSALTFLHQKHLLLTFSFSFPLSQSLCVCIFLLFYFPVSMLSPCWKMWVHRFKLTLDYSAKSSTYTERKQELHVIIIVLRLWFLFFLICLRVLCVLSFFISKMKKNPSTYTLDIACSI